MFGFSTFGEATFGVLPDRLERDFREGTPKAGLALSSLIIPETATAEGILVRSVGVLWFEIVRQLGNDWSLAFNISWTKWEEIFAGAFKQDRFDEVVLTPRSGDHGRDVIATKKGVGCVRILGSMKAFGPENLVGYDHVRALAGVLSTDLAASKGILATTSNFPPNIEKEQSIAPLLHTRLELMDGATLLKWLKELAAGK